MRRVALLVLAAALAGAQTLRNPNSSSLIPISQVINLATELANRALKSATFTVNRVAKINSSGEIESVAAVNPATDCLHPDGSSGACDATDVVKQGVGFQDGAAVIVAGKLTVPAGLGTDCVKVNGTSGTCGGNNRFVQEASLHDDFTSGQALVTAASIGAIGGLQWSVGGASIQASQIGIVTSGFGVYALTSTANNDTATMYLSPENGTSWVKGDTQVDAIFGVAVSTTANDIRAGFSEAISTAAPNSGCYFERLTADSSWFAVCRAIGGTQTRTGVSSFVANQKVYLRIRQSGGAWFFSMSATLANLPSQTEIQIATNLPLSSWGMNPFVQFKNLGGGAIEVDMFDLVVTY